MAKLDIHPYKTNNGDTDSLLARCLAVLKEISGDLSWCVHEDVYSAEMEQRINALLEEAGWLNPKRNDTRDKR